MNTNKTIEEMLPKKKEMSIQMTSSSGESSSYNVPIWTWAAFPDLTEFWTPYTEYNQAIDDVLYDEVLGLLDKE